MKTALFLFIAPFMAITSALSCAAQDTDMVAASSSYRAPMEDSQSPVSDIIVHKLGGLYSTQLEEDLFLALERQPCDPTFFWKDYASTQRAACHMSDKIFKKAGLSAVDPFQNALWHKEINDIYVAYACYHFPIKDGVLAHADKANIEMCFAVLTDNGSAFLGRPALPWVTHMGIQRSMFAVSQGKVQHKNLSMRLHSFVAACMLSFCPEKDYLITTPLPVMRNIMKKSMPEGSVFLGSSRFPARLAAHKACLEEDYATRAGAKSYKTRILELNELQDALSKQDPESPLIRPEEGPARLMLASGTTFTVPYTGAWLFSTTSFAETGDLPYAIVNYRALASLYFDGAAVTRAPTAMLL